MDKCFDFTLKEESSMLVCGPTMAGKSTFVHALLSDKNIFEKQPSNVYWYHGGENDVGLNDKGYIIKRGLADNFWMFPMAV